MVLSINEIKDKIKLCGRCAINDNKIIADWVGSGFEINFSGSFIRVFFETKANNNPVYVCSEIDGIRQKTAISNSNEVLVIDNLENTEHNFKIIRITEVFSPMNNIEDYLMITGIELGAAGEFEILGTPSDKKMLIDFYGDSITNAWASLAEPDDEKRRICDNDYTVSYAYLTADLLNADARVCAVSGHGVLATCDGDGSEPMKLYYDMESRSLPIKSDFSKKADVVVAALGTNDAAGGVSDDEFKCAAKEFVEMIRKDNKTAKIVWMYGMMNEKFIPVLQQLVKELNQKDENVFFLPINRVKREDDETGAFGHPNRKGQKRIAYTLTEYIKSIL